MPYSHDHLLGKSGHRAVMAEFLRRGYKLAVPEVDTGDDFLVLDEYRGSFQRVQVKTSTAGYRAQFFIPTRQLETPKRPDLFYVLAARAPEQTPQERAVDHPCDRVRRHPSAMSRRIASPAGPGRLPGARWDFVVISRKTLKRANRRDGFGTLDAERVLVGVAFRADSVRGHGLQAYRNNWSRYWPPLVEQAGQGPRAHRIALP